MTKICFVSIAVLILLRISGLMNIDWIWILSPLWIRELVWMMKYMIVIIMEEIHHR